MFRMKCKDGIGKVKDFFACKKHHILILDKWMRLRHEDLVVEDAEAGTQCVLCPEKVTA